MIKFSLIKFSFFDKATDSCHIVGSQKERISI